jgi:hypothetical protein
MSTLIEPQARKIRGFATSLRMGKARRLALRPPRTSRDVRFRAAIGEIADVEVLRLTLIAPDIVEMILDGRQPPALQFEQFRKSLHSNGRHNETPYTRVSAACTTLGTDSRLRHAFACARQARLD